jgi:hypothetical protein
MTCFSETFGTSLPTVSIVLRRVDLLRRDVDHRSLLRPLLLGHGLIADDVLAEQMLKQLAVAPVLRISSSL